AHARDEAGWQGVDPAVSRQADHEEAGGDPDGEGEGESRRVGRGGEAGPGDVRARGDRRESGPRGAGARRRQVADQVEVREAGGALRCRGRSPKRGGDGFYGKESGRTRQVAAHDGTGAKGGDTVRIVETRPLSKTKRWRVVESVERAK